MRGYGVSPSGTKAKLVEKILEHEIKQRVSDFNEEDVVEGASSWRRRGVDDESRGEKEESGRKRNGSRMLKDTYGFGRDGDNDEETRGTGEDDEEDVDCLTR